MFIWQGCNNNVVEIKMRERECITVGYNGGSQNETFKVKMKERGRGEGIKSGGQLSE